MMYRRKTDEGERAGTNGDDGRRRGDAFLQLTTVVPQPDGEGRRHRADADARQSYHWLTIEISAGGDAPLRPEQSYDLPTRVSVWGAAHAHQTKGEFVEIVEYRLAAL